MSEISNENEIPKLEPKLFFGLSTNIAGNVHFLSDTQLLHPAGKILVIDSLTDGSQQFIKIPPSRKEISITSVSSNRKYVVVAEKGDRPSLSIYDVTTLERVKLLGIPMKESTAKDWASVAFMQDNEHLVGVTGEPDWNYLIYEWKRGKVLSFGVASLRDAPVKQVIPNPDDVTMLAFVGPGLFRLMSQSDNVWRQYGFSRGENVPFQCGCWIGSHQLLTGSRDGRLLLIEYGELRAVYQADQLMEIHLSENAVKVSESVTLASQTVTEDNKKGIHEVRAMTSFGNGFFYSCNPGEIMVFQKLEKLRWVKRNVIKIPSPLSEQEYKKMYGINHAAVNPSNNKVVCTTKKTELYVSKLFPDVCEKGIAYTEFERDGTGYHDRLIVALSSCLWKPIFLTAGGHDKTIRIWNYEQQKVVITRKFSDEIYSAALHPSGYFCLLGFTDKLCFMLILMNDLITVRHVDIRGCKNVAFSGGGHIFAATRDQVIEVYSSIYFNRLHVLHGHIGPVARLVFGLRDKTLWSCGAEGSLYEWDMDTGERLGDIFTNKNGQLGLTVGDAVYSVGTDGKLKEIINGEISREIDMQQSSLTCVTLGNAGQMLFLGGEKSSIVSVFYPLVHPPKWTEFTMHSQPIADIVITHDEKTLITTSEDGFLCIWSILCNEDKRMDMNRGFGHVTEVLLSLEELEEMTSGLKELSDRLEETEGEHEYAIRQITASNDTILRETNNNYTAIIDDLKFRIKQMEREHLVEINKYQTKLKEEKGSHGDAMEQLEKCYSEKLLAELKKIEILEKEQIKSMEESERMKNEMDEKFSTFVAQMEKEKNIEIEKYITKINELEMNMKRATDEKENMKIVLEEQFNKEKESISYLFEIKISEKEKLLNKLKDENGVLVKSSQLRKKKIDELKRDVRKLECDLIAKEEKFRILFEESKIIQSQLEEKESVISKKDKLMVKITKQNDICNKELHYRDTTVEALIQKLNPRDFEIKIKSRLVEEKNKQIHEMNMLCTKHGIEIKELKKKLVVAEQEINKRKTESIKIKGFLRKLNTEMYLMSSLIFQPDRLQNKIADISKKLLSNYNEDVQQDMLTYTELIKKQNIMEKIIKRLRNRLERIKPRNELVGPPYKVFFQLLSEFNYMASQINEKRRKVRYLQILLKLSRKKGNLASCSMQKKIF